MLEELGEGPGATRRPSFQFSRAGITLRMRSRAHMTLITPEERISETAELLRSVHGSIRDLRQTAEDLRRQIKAGEDADLTGPGKRIGQVLSLVRECQKLEAQLVELYNRQTGIAQGGYALDLDSARIEVGCRLARLRACRGSGEISE